MIKYFFLFSFQKNLLTLSRKFFNRVGPAGGSLSSGSWDPLRFPRLASTPAGTVAGKWSRRSSSFSQFRWWQCKPRWFCNPPLRTLPNRTRFGPNRPVREPSQGSSIRRRVQIPVVAGSCTRRDSCRESPLFGRDNWSVKAWNEKVSGNKQNIRHCIREQKIVIKKVTWWNNKNNNNNNNDNVGEREKMGVTKRGTLQEREQKWYGSCRLLSQVPQKLPEPLKFLVCGLWFKNTTFALLVV